MGRITAPATVMGEHMDWALHRPKMAAGMGALSEAVYSNSTLAVREREAARYTIAMINDCAVCQDTRVRDGANRGADEPLYAELTDWRSAASLSARERAAAEFAERFALDHLAMDDAYWDGLRALFDEANWPISPSPAACGSAWAGSWPWSGCVRPTSASWSEPPGRSRRRPPAPR